MTAAKTASPKAMVISLEYSRSRRAIGSRIQFLPNKCWMSFTLLLSFGMARGSLLHALDTLQGYSAFPSVILSEAKDLREAMRPVRFCKALHCGYAVHP